MLPRQVADPRGRSSRNGVEVHDIDDDEFFCSFGIKQRKYKRRRADACVHHFHVVGERKLQQFLRHGGTKTVIGEEEVSASCYDDLRVRHFQARPLKGAVRHASENPAFRYSRRSALHTRTYQHILSFVIVLIASSTTFGNIIA